MTRIGSPDVARVFLAALEQGLPPARQVEILFGVPRTTAAKWVRHAKDQGLIPDENFSGKSRRNEKVEAIARDLGVTPERLIESVRKHAAGDLRLR